MRLKKGMAVEVPEGTKMRYFSGSLLDPASIHVGEFEYTAVAKVVDDAPRKGWINVALWRNRAKYPSYCCVEARSLRPSKLILDYNDYDECRVSDPDDPIPDNEREYRVSATIRSVLDGNRFQSTTHSYIIWAANREESLRGVRLFFEGQNAVFRSHLYRKRKPCRKQ